MGDEPTTKAPYPHTAFCFKVELAFAKKNAVAYFRSVSGLKYEAEIIDLREGGDNVSARKLMGGGKWSNLVFKKGFTGTSEMLAWREGWMEPGGARSRLTGKITQLNSAMGDVCSWSFVKGIPVKWEISDFDASKNEVSIETLEIAHEGLTYKAADATAAPASGSGSGSGGSAARPFVAGNQSFDLE